MEYFDAAARERDLPFRTDGDQLANLSEQRTALSCLREVVLRCEHEDMRTPVVRASLAFLRLRLSATASVARFGQALSIEHPRARCEALKYHLRGIEEACEAL
jgi:hypothetical protein